MFVAATLSVLTALIPQDPGTAPADAGATAAPEKQQPILAERDLQSLNDKMREYLSAELAYDWAEGARDREKAAKARRKAKEKFEKEWERCEKKGNVLGSMPDLQAIFYNCFEREKPRHSKGQLRPREDKDANLDFHFFVPKNYSEKTPWRTVVVLPHSTGTAGEWVDADDYWKQTWDGAALLEDSIVVVPTPPARTEMDPVPDYSREGAEADERARNGAVLGAFGDIMRNYNVDRAKVYLDCGRDTCGYGLRLVSLFPDRFAGVILRDPIAVDDIRIGSLKHVPLLLLKSGDNGARVEALKTRFDERCPGMATVLEAKGAYPHLESAPDIEQWLADKKREMSPLHVVIEPNHDRYNRSYWVDIITAESLLTTAPDEKPRLDVKADRKNNRITVTAVGIERFELMLNDAIVDLDKEFTVVVNGTAETEQRVRSFRLLKEGLVQRSDWDYLFPVRYSATVTKE